MCSVRGLLSRRFGQSEGRTGGRREAGSFVFGVGSNEKKREGLKKKGKKNEMLVDSTGRLS